tara:strand:- start:76 stop:570 length:495 start_codon:yes stop_codon:yes gene_type:complete
MKSLRDRLEWDSANGAIHDREIPYLLIRPDSLMGIFGFLQEAERAAAFEAFARSIAYYGKGSAESYQALGGAQADILMATIAETAPQLGWGVWSLIRIDGGLSLTVRNSPFAAGFGESDTPVCAPIRGMLEAVASLVLGVAVSVQEMGCVSCGADICTFEAVPA